MYSNTDFEKFWFLYKTEGEPNGVSINTFCVTHHVPYTEFNQWFRKTHKGIVKVQVEGLLEESEVDVQSASPASSNVNVKGSGDIMVTIRTRSGLEVRKCNLSYQGLRLLVEKLEGIC